MPQFAVQGTPVHLEFQQIVNPTGPNVPVLFIAADGTRSRGVVIKLSQMLLWSMNPKPMGPEDYPEIAAQRSLVHLQEMLHDGEAFFAEQQDAELLLNVDNSEPYWDPNHRILL